MEELRKEGQGRGFFPQVTFFYPSLKVEVSKGQQTTASVGDSGADILAPLQAPCAALCLLQRPAGLQLCTSSALQTLNQSPPDISTVLWLLILSKRSTFTDFSCGVEKHLEKIYITLI